MPRIPPKAEAMNTWTNEADISAPYFACRI